MAIMRFNKHKSLEGRHAILSGSDYHWLNDDEEKLKARLNSYEARIRGTEIHEYAKKAIELKIRQRDIKETLCMYINDAIDFNMKPEVILVYSENCYGTADAICYKDGQLRIHDLKTGKTPASMKQLRIYAAFFCLEYGFKPNEIDIELRIYQNNKRIIEHATVEDIATVMSKVITADKIIRKFKEV